MIGRRFIGAVLLFGTPAFLVLLLIDPQFRAAWVGAALVAIATVPIALQIDSSGVPA